MIQLPRFYQTESDFKTIHHQLKLTPCPHCDQVGTLNLHGFLIGYDINGHHGLKRGHRIYCSNRGRRPGCGKTFSIHLFTLLKNFIISSDLIWKFIHNIFKGLNTFQAFDSLKSKFKTSTAYRLLNTIKINQSRIRTQIFIKRSKPKYSPSPLTETIQHLRDVLTHHKNPVASYQIAFQTPFI